jgi:acetyltransferase-like isoleucine patch superfamily enzyme
VPNRLLFLYRLYVKNIRKYRGVRERISITFGYFRGTLTSFRFKKRAFVCVGRGLDLKIFNGDVDVENFVLLYPNIKLWCEGIRKKSYLRIGQETQIGNNTQIRAGEFIDIGKRVLIAWDVVIMDRDFHPVDGFEERIKPVVIEDYAWICCRAIILKGVTIGHHAIVGAGAVVTKSVKPFEIVAGNPARVVGKRQMHTTE